MVTAPVISRTTNCVINLSVDKDAVFREGYRVLQPGGRLSISDIVVDGDLPQFIRTKLDAWAGCIAGALDESVYLNKIRAAGFEGWWGIDPALRRVCSFTHSRGLAEVTVTPI